MEKGKKKENVTGKEENRGSKIPKPGKFTSAKEIRSKTLVEKKTVQSSKTAIKITTKATSNQKQKQITNLPKNVKRMSVVKISKDVINQFQNENMKSDEHAHELTAGIKVPDKENTAKREPLKQKFSQVSQKQSGNLPKKQSEPDLKQCAAFGGIRFTAKRNTCRKPVFQKMAKESNDRQVIAADCQAPEPCTKDLRRTTSAKEIGSKDIEWSNERKLEDPSTFKTESSTTKSCTKELKRATSAKEIGSKGKEWSNKRNLYPQRITINSSKATSVTVKESTMKKCAAFGGIRFSPKWQSTPLKPDLFLNLQKVSKHDKELHPPDSSANWLEKIPNSAKEDEIITIDETINIDETITLDETINLDETVQPEAKEPKCVKPVSIAMKEISEKLFPAFAGMRLTPKRKSTHPKPDIFERVQEESQLSDLESHPPGSSSEKMKPPSDATKAILKTEIQHSHVEMLEQNSTQKAQSSETVLMTLKETSSQVAAFGSIRFAPKLESTPIRPNMFEIIQKKSLKNYLESQTAGLSTKELKTIPASTTISEIKETLLSDDEKLALLTTQKPESSKNDEAAKKIVPPAFGGLRFKTRQKNLHNVFEARKT